ncbi:MAG: XrtB/PEP-CTERM-associated transcriptional regulator EpsA [Burkholderiales bacterium]
MQTPTQLNAGDIERFVFIVEMAQKIRSRERFRYWSQGVLQGILPSKAMVFGLSCRGGGTAYIDHVSSTPMAEETFRSLFHAEAGLLTHVLHAWARGGYAPVLYRSGACDTANDTPIGAALDHHRFENVALHGTCPIDGYHSVFYAFLDIPERSLEKFSRLLDLLVPHLFTTTARLLMEERQSSSSIPEMSGALLTARQQQVLKWICAGKSNFEIASVLCVSPLTVKNHVQNLFRRLKVQNRAQAVGKGLSLGIVSDRDHESVNTALTNGTPH